MECEDMIKIKATVSQFSHEDLCVAPEMQSTSPRWLLKVIPYTPSLTKETMANMWAV